MVDGDPRVMVAATNDVSRQTLERIKRLNEEAHRHPFVEDWDHALGGVHFFVEEEDEPVAHASVVERQLETWGTSLRTGYVEAAATRPDRQGRGLMAVIMTAVTAHIRDEFELGALCTGHNAFYERFGWETWHGETYVRTPHGLERTAHEDGNVMVLRTNWTPALDFAAPISCEWRSGDVW
jgi:aminoglycoside 2'-N-acetyltransferase I